MLGQRCHGPGFHLESGKWRDGIDHQWSLHTLGDCFKMSLQGSRCHFGAEIVRRDDQQEIDAQICGPTAQANRLLCAFKTGRRNQQLRRLDKLPRRFKQSKPLVRAQIRHFSRRPANHKSPQREPPPLPEILLKGTNPHAPAGVHRCHHGNHDPSKTLDQLLPAHHCIFQRPVCARTRFRFKWFGCPDFDDAGPASW